MSLTEGGSTGSYSVKLTAAPNANVTVTVTSGDTGAVTSNKAKLTFTANNWNTGQTVTLTPKDDADGASESVAISHAATGGGYDDVSADLTATVADDDRGHRALGVHGGPDRGRRHRHVHGQGWPRRRTRT